MIPKLIFYFILIIFFIKCSSNDKSNESSHSYSNNWFNYCNKSGGYSIQFPNEPTDYDTVITGHFSKYNLNSYFISYNPYKNEYNNFYLIEHKIYSDSILKLIGLKDFELINSQIDTIQKLFESEIVRSEIEKSDIGYCKAKRVKMFNADKSTILSVKVIFCNNTLYTLMVSSTPKEQRNIYINKYMNSFAIKNCK
ncbi:MAG: hypothetical protein WD048_11050 [Chitinophagales bacterium]